MHLSDALKIVAFANSVNSPKSHEIFKFRDDAKLRNSNAYVICSCATSIQKSCSKSYSSGLQRKIFYIATFWPLQSFANEVVPLLPPTDRETVVVVVFFFEGGWGGGTRRLEPGRKWEGRYKKREIWGREAEFSKWGRRDILNSTGKGHKEGNKQKGRQELGFNHTESKKSGSLDSLRGPSLTPLYTVQ